MEWTVNKEIKEEHELKRLEELFKKRWHKRVDRDYWWHKYLLAIIEVHNIEGMIGMREEDVTLPKQTGNKEVKDE